MFNMQQPTKRKTSAKGYMCLIHAIFPDAVDSSGVLYCTNAEQKLTEIKKYAVNRVQEIRAAFETKTLENLQPPLNSFDLSVLEDYMHKDNPGYSKNDKAKEGELATAFNKLTYEREPFPDGKPNPNGRVIESTVKHTISFDNIYNYKILGEEENYFKQCLSSAEKDIKDIKQDDFNNGGLCYYIAQRYNIGIQLYNLTNGQLRKTGDAYNPKNSSDIHNICGMPGHFSAMLTDEQFEQIKNGTLKQLPIPKPEQQGAKAEREKAEQKLKQEREEAEQKLKQEREEAERKREKAEQKLKREEAERKLKREREEAERKREQKRKEYLINFDTLHNTKAPQIDITAMQGERGQKSATQNNNLGRYYSKTKTKPQPSDIKTAITNVFAKVESEIGDDGEGKVKCFQKIMQEIIEEKENNNNVVGINKELSGKKAGFTAWKKEFNAKLTAYNNKTEYTVADMQKISVLFQQHSKGILDTAVGRHYEKNGKTFETGMRSYRAVQILSKLRSKSPQK
jgi:hypothetical protein